MTFDKIYAYQDVVLSKVFTSEGRLFPGAEIILGGGIALAGCYLHHRISHDLDFFVSQRFDPRLILRRLQNEGIILSEVEVESDPNFAAQLSGLIEEGGERIKVSFIEDIYTGMFPVKKIEGIRTETIEGLYHRKLRTITGVGETTSSTGRPISQGYRQTARDLFDLYVLSREVKPLGDFLIDINRHGANVSEIGVESGMRRMPWIDLMDEFESLEIADKYKGFGFLDIKRYFDDVLNLSKKL
ncbi:MAG: nucleotidyl transferase AbiEii/AbiGii toxin family protein [Thermodesulfobacteriota bacterium]